MSYISSYKVQQYLEHASIQSTFLSCTKVGFVTQVHTNFLPTRSIGMDPLSSKEKNCCIRFLMSKLLQTITLSNCMLKKKNQSREACTTIYHDPIYVYCQLPEQNAKYNLSSKEQEILMENENVCSVASLGEKQQIKQSKTDLLRANPLCMDCRLLDGLRICFLLFMKFKVVYYNDIDFAQCHRFLHNNFAS